MWPCYNIVICNEHDTDADGHINTVLAHTVGATPCLHHMSQLCYLHYYEQFEPQIQ